MQAEGSILSCDQLWRTPIEGQAKVKAEQSSSTHTGEEQAALRRGLHAQIAAHAHFNRSALVPTRPTLFLKNRKAS